MEAKRAIPVPAEKSLKNFYSFLMLVKEDLVGGTIGTRTTQDQNARIREKRLKMLEQLKSIADILPKHMDLNDIANSREQELVELVKSSEDDISRDYMAAQNRWVDLLLDKVSDILDSTQYVNLEKLTQLMEQNDAAGMAMEGKDVVLLMGSPGAGKTTTLHYFAGTSFREITREGVTYFKPIDVIDPTLKDMKVSCGGKEVITRHLQVASVTVDGEEVVLCDTPSFGDHESIEEVIANSLGLVRAIQKAKTVRPVLVLSRDEIGFRDQFNAYPQILSILVRMLGTDSNVNLEPFSFVFTKYDAKNSNCLRRQFSMFLKDDDEGSKRSGGKNEKNKEAIIQHLLEHTDPDSNIVVPTRGDPIDFLRNLMSNESVVECPEEFFVPNLSDSILTTMKRQLKFTLLDLRDALSKNDNSTGIHRMQQMSKLANLLPEAGIYARHGFKAFKEIINQMVEEEDYDDDDDDYSEDSGNQDDLRFTESNELKFSDSKESFASSESEQWSNLSSGRIRKSNSNDMLVSRHLSTVPEAEEEVSDDGIDNDSSDRDSGMARRSPKLVTAPSRSPTTLAGIHPMRGPPIPYRDLEIEEPSTDFMALAAQCDQQNLDQEHDTSGTDTTSERVSHGMDSGMESGMESGMDSSMGSSAPLKNMKGVPVRDAFSSSDESDDIDEVILDSEEEEEDEVTPQQIMDPQDMLPEEKQAYAQQYSHLLKEMTIKAVEEEDYVLAVQRMHEFMRLAKNSPDHIRGHPQFKRCVELFLMFSVALKECDYHQCLIQLEDLIRMGEAGIIEAKKCSECGVNAAIKHIVELRERVVSVTSRLHLIDDPDEFDRVSENLRLLRRKVDKSNMLMEACMRGSNERGKSETVLACISYGFKVARLGR